MQHRRRSLRRDWRTLQEKAHLPKVQAIIREEIIRGTIRVAPAPGGGILIIPTGARSDEASADWEVDASSEEDEAARFQQQPAVDCA